MLLFSKVIKAWNPKYTEDKQVVVTINTSRQVHVSIGGRADGSASVTFADPKEAEEFAHAILKGLAQT